MTRVVLVDDCDLFLETLSGYLGAQGFYVSGLAHSREEAISVIARTEPDIVVLDCVMGLGGRECMRAGMDAISAILKVAGWTRIIMFTVYVTKQWCADALSLGAYGYVNKSSPFDILHTAITQAQQGHKYVDPSLLERPSKEIVQAYLTAVERHILTLLARDLNIVMIAAELGVSEQNATLQVKRLSAKLDKNDPEDLVRFAKGYVRG